MICWNRSCHLHFTIETGNPFQGIALSFKCADVRVARGSLRQLQRLGNLAIGQLLKMSECQDFAIDWIKRIQDFLQSDLDFRPQGGV
jgi:hypothetical protein